MPLWGNPIDDEFKSGPDKRYAFFNYASIIFLYLQVLRVLIDIIQPIEHQFLKLHIFVILFLLSLGLLHVQHHLIIEH